MNGYFSPMVEVLEVEVEVGFLNSGQEEISDVEVEINGFKGGGLF